MKASDFYRDADGNWHRKPPFVKIAGPNSFVVDVVGESHYQTSLSSICGGHTIGGHRLHKLATLIHEDRNRFDSMAVRIDIEGKTVGYLSREDARRFRAEMEKSGFTGIPARCIALIVGGWDQHGDRGFFGVKLDLPWAPAQEPRTVDGPTAKAIGMINDIEKRFERLKGFIRQARLQSNDVLYERLDELRIEIDSYTDDVFLDEWD